MKARTFFLFLGSLLLYVLPATAQAYDYTFCIYYRADTIDSGFGEDYYTSTNNWKARGAHIKVMQHLWPYSTQWEGFASESSGCFAFSSSLDRFIVRIYAEAEFGPIDQRVRVTARPTTNDPIPYWNITTGVLASGQYSWVSPAGPTSTMMGIGDFSAYWWHTHGAPWSGSIPGPLVDINLVNQICPSGVGSCAYPDFQYIEPGSEGRKFLVAHEVGHQYFRGVLGGAWPWDCSVNEGGRACQFDNGQNTAHALHSKEFQSCALSESFAHFFATDVFNDHDETDGHFHYYKTGYPASVDVESGPEGGVTAFMENTCSGSDGGRGVELDWLRAFWDYHTNAPSTGDPGHGGIISQIIASYTNNPTYFHANAYWYFLDESWQERWEESAAWNGIDH